jgi:glycosyltransferase involved in cell wall biosynthesis
MDFNKFSVLMSVYHKDEPLFLERSLQSLMNQTLLPAQIVLVADGPLTDELDNVINQFVSIYSEYFTIVRLSTNQGPAKAWRTGLETCKHQFVARMDADDISLPTRFEKQINFFKQNPHIDVVGTFYYEFEDNENNIIALKKFPTSHNELFKYSKKQCPLCHPSVMYKKQSVIQAGNYTEEWKLIDYGLWMRMFYTGCNFANIPESLLMFRGGQNIVSRRGGLKYMNMEYNFLKKCFHNGYISSFEFMYNCLTRLSVRLLPPSMRKFLYFHLLRSRIS